MNRLKIAALAVLAFSFAGCSSTPQFQSGDEAEVTHDGLTRLDKTVLDVVWARTDIDLSGYKKIMLDGVGVEYRPSKGPFSGRAGSSSTSIARSSAKDYQLDDATKKVFEDEIAGAFVEEMARSEKYEIVDQPGPDVLLVRGGLLDVVSMVPPEPMGRGAIFIDSVGEATLVLELRDSESNAILARAVDRRAAQSTGTFTESNRVTNRAEVRRLGRRWASTLRSGLETLIGSD